MSLRALSPPSAARLLLAALGLTAGAILAGGAAPPATHETVVRDGWEALALARANEARRIFAGVPRGADPAARAARLGEAVALLNVQPRSERNLERARLLLRSLASGSIDDIAIAARYHLARIDHVHSLRPNLDAAEASYRALLADHPGHPLAEQAAPKLALLVVYRSSDPDLVEGRLRELEALADRLVDRSAARDTRLLLAQAALRLQGNHARAVTLLRPVLEQSTISRANRWAEAWLIFAESSAALGHAADAARGYREFLLKLPRDARAAEVTRRFAALGTDAASPP
jgi:tetratricopeptide (TPR) repeat protein